MAPLSSKQAKEMRAHAQRLGNAGKLVIVQVGKNGLTDGVTKSVDEALTAHEIVKVRVGEASDDSASDAATILAADLGACCAGRVGGTVLMVRVRTEGPSTLRPLLAV